MLMAKRRFWRAVRGRSISTSTCAGERSTKPPRFLLQGMDRGRAMAMVRRYSLKPGYQLAYTMGRRRFRRLYDEPVSTGKGSGRFRPPDSGAGGNRF
jgi:hypothetical protein